VLNYENVRTPPEGHREVVEGEITMPRCVDCGTETPREEMFGASDELRCARCVRRRFPANEPRPVSPLRAAYKPPVTIAVIVIAVVVTILHWSNVGAARLLFADPAPIWDGQLWRLFTSVFPHLHPLHLVFNLLWMWRFGRALDRWLGSWRFALLLLPLAAGPVAAEVLLGNSGAGLSGMIYGLFGFLFALRHDEEFAAEQVPPAVIQTMVVWFFLCIALTYFDVLQVGNAAHGVGAVLGWLFGRAYLSRFQWLATSGVVLLTLVLVAATQYMPWNARYDWHRGQECALRGDYEGAAYWFGQAADRLSGEQRDHALNIVKWAESQRENAAP
jgi:membrane associated rhomboid family serine protease